MDALAKEIALGSIRSRQTTTFHTTTLGFGTVTCAGVMITSRFQQSLYYYILRNKTYARLSVLLKLPLHLLTKEVNWKILQSARK